MVAYALCALKTPTWVFQNLHLTDLILQNLKNETVFLFIFCNYFFGLQTGKK